MEMEKLSYESGKLSHVSGKAVSRDCNSCLLEVEKLPHGSENADPWK
jgi:hypothetical protein